jgi:hypothetical protein
MVKSTGKEYTSGQMELSMMAIGKIAKSMDMAY